MTEYKMNDEWRKKLTEKLLGEHWHEYTVIDGVRHCSCGVIGNLETIFNHKGHRTFTTDADMLAVFRKIRDKGKLSKFDMFCQDIFLEYTGYDNICDMCNEYQNWLFLDNPERACCLAAMWLEEQG